MNEYPTTTNEVHITGYIRPDHAHDFIMQLDDLLSEIENPIIITHDPGLKRRIEPYAKDQRLPLFYADEDRPTMIVQLETARYMIAVNPNDDQGRRAFHRYRDNTPDTYTAIIRTRKDPPIQIVTIDGELLDAPPPILSIRKPDRPGSRRTRRPRK